jgi:hypothetical protein
MNMDPNTVSRSHDRGRLRGHRSRKDKQSSASAAKLAAAFRQERVCPPSQYL